MLSAGDRNRSERENHCFSAITSIKSIFRDIFVTSPAPPAPSAGAVQRSKSGEGWVNESWLSYWKQQRHGQSSVWQWWIVTHSSWSIVSVVLVNRYIFGMVNRESVVMVNRYLFVVVKDTPKRPPKTKRHHQKRPPKIRLPENTKWSFLMFVDIFGCFLMVFDGFYSMEEGPMERFRVSPDHHLTTKIDPK